MNEEEIENFRQQLRHLKTELEQVEKASHDSGDKVVLDQSRVGRLSRMDALQSQQMALEVGRRRIQQLQKIEGALNRIVSGDFGYCFVCGEQIDGKRLAADPTCTCCIKCAETS